MAKPPSNPTSVAEAHAAGLAMLSRREVSSLQVRQRLARRGFQADAVDGAIARLQASGALDDRRVALAAARTRVQVKHQGRARIQRELSALGVDHDVARDALGKVFEELDEQALLEQALEKRLRRGQDPRDPAVARRLFAALVRQGFAPGAVQRAIRRRRSTDER